MYIDIDNNCGISGEQIIKAGALALTYVDEVQKLGNVDINLYAVMTCKVRGESLTVAIKIKDAGKAYSLRRIAFPIAHPAMLRRLLFKHIETTDLISDPAWARGYGMAYDAKKANPEWFILPSAEKLTDTGYRLNSLEYETYAKYVNDYNSNTKL